MGMQSKPDNGLVGKPIIFKDIFLKERCQILKSAYAPPPSTPILGALSQSAKVKNLVKYLYMKLREYYCPGIK